MAESHAEQNFSSNLAALDRLQCELRPQVNDYPLIVEWIFARDRTLTALDETGHWANGCSLPRRAADAMLARLKLTGSVACFLTPAHAAQIRSALTILRPEQAIVAIIPDVRDLAIILHCDDFAADIESHRLWFAAGEDWESDLQKLFEQQEGLPTPAQFIRAPDADADIVESLISIAQRIFTEIGNSRSGAMHAIRISGSPIKKTKHCLCIVGGSRFRLWNDLGDAMLRVFAHQTNIDIVHYDADDPASNSPLALQKTASHCSAILTANTSRTDLPGLIPETTPWITWVTTPRIPSSVLAAENDHLIVIDPALHDIAIKSAWRASHVHVGAWPQPEASIAPANGARFLSIIADTFSLETPDELNEYSSHRLLWESIRRELLEDPFMLNDPSTFLGARMRRMGVGEENFSVSRFIDKLILPAYHRGLAQFLIDAKLPVRLYGLGWETDADFTSHAAGAIRTRNEFHQAIADAKALVHVWPSNFAHPIDSMSKFVLRCRDGKKIPFIRDAKAALSNQSIISKPAAPAISCDLIRSLISPLGLYPMHG